MNIETQITPNPETLKFIVGKEYIFQDSIEITSEKEAEVFGNRTVSGFLSQVGAEEAMSSDQVVWSEQGRLHISLIGSLVTNTGIFTVVSGFLLWGITSPTLRKIFKYNG